MRCAKSQKLYNMAIVPLQICNGTNRCCKSFIILYSLFSLLSLHFFFSLLSHSPVPFLFSLYRFHLSSTSLPFTLACRFPATVNVASGHHSETKSGLRLSLHSPWLIKNTSIIVRSLSIALDEKLLEKTPGGGRGEGDARSTTLDLADLTSRSSSISPSSLSSLSTFHSASLWLWVFIFYFLVDLMVVVGCGLWAVTMAVVVGCGGDGRWWLSVLLMIMGEGIIYYFNE